MKTTAYSCQNPCRKMLGKTEFRDMTRCEKNSTIGYIFHGQNSETKEKQRSHTLKPKAWNDEVRNTSMGDDVVEIKRMHT